jgi:hypothetical protein
MHSSIPHYLHIYSIQTYTYCGRYKPSLYGLQYYLWYIVCVSVWNKCEQWDEVGRKSTWSIIILTYLLLLLIIKN